MFTQCSKCETVFRLSAEVLRAAGGQVRCGRCGEVFNALARLAEDSSGFVKGESSLDSETRADEILQSLDAVAPVDAAMQPMAPPMASSVDSESTGTEIARLEIIEPVDYDLGSEASLEFTLPPGELDRIFVETSPTALHLFTVERLVLEPAPAPEPGPGPVPLPIAAPAPEAASMSAPPPITAPVPTSGPAPAARAGGLEVSEDVRREMLSSYTHAELPEINVLRPQLPRAAWLAAAIVLAALLLLQVVRSNGEWLAVHAPLLAGGRPTAAALSAYQLRQWGVTGDPGARGTLRVRATILNTSAQLQPYPLLRVTLANRFGTRVGAREFEPAEYLGKPTAHLLGPGERIDATLDILDPGKDAEGFEIDVCIRGSEKKILCAGDAAAAGAAAAGAATQAH